MDSKTVINVRSALNQSTKRTVLTQELLRILPICSRLLPWERTVENVNEMVLRTHYSGYSRKFRYEIVDSAFKACRARKKAEQEGERSLHRPKEWKKEEREQGQGQGKIGKRSSWYKRGGNDAVFFVPDTATEEADQKEIKQQGFKEKVVEKTGIAVRDCSRSRIHSNSHNVRETAQ